MKDPRWIWTGAAVPERNASVRFRRSFRSRATARLRLSISADSRYWIWINGGLLGFGPIRSWTNHWKYDDYDLTGFLRDGENVIAVLVNHLGVGTFQYLPAKPGLAVQLRRQSGSLLLQTNGQWLSSPSKAYAAKAPRISVQQGFEEQFDARREDDWMLPGYAATKWTSAVGVPPPHLSLEPRGIPFLTADPVVPRIVRAERIRPAEQTWTLDLRSFFLPEDISGRVHFIRGHLFTQVWSETAQTVAFVRPHHHLGEFKVNKTIVPALDRALPPASQAQSVRLKTGWNSVLIPIPDNPLPENPPPRSHFGWFVLVVRAARPLVWSARGTPSGAAWGFVGPFAFTSGELEHIRSDRDYPRLLVVPPRDPQATPSAFQAFYDAPAPADEIVSGSWFREIPDTCIYRDDVFASAAGDSPLGKHALADGQILSIAPGKDGEDIRLLLDFEKEIVGCHTFEIEAEAGTVLDFHNFEFIRPDGLENWAEGMNNSFRYTCREGVQRYRSLVRRGFRYTWLICRNLRSPLRIRSIGAEFITWPQERQGRFQSSDALLNTIWEVGAHTLRCCAEDTYTDCPANEQVFWAGDARNEALVDWTVNGDARLWLHSLLMTGQSLENPDFPITASHVPSAWPNIVPAGSFLWMRSCREYLLWTGDYAGARQLLPWIRKNVQGIAEHTGNNGLFRLQAYNLFDWAPMDTPPTGTITHLNCFAILALNDCAQFARWLEDENLAARLLKMAASIKKAVNRNLWDKERNAYIDCIHADGGRSTVFSQQTQAVAVLSGVAAGARGVECRKWIDAPPADFVRAGSPFFGFFLLELLAREDREQALIDLIRRDWGSMVLQGATTFWEMWSLPGRLTRSHCHGWSAAPTFFLSAAVLGIEPLSPGFATVRISPRLGDLKFVQGVMPTPRGPIEVRFEQEGGKLSSHIRQPEGITLKKARPKRHAPVKL